MIAALSVVLCLISFAPLTAQNESFKIIVHEANPVSSISKETAARMFVKKIQKWDNGSKLSPVDQATSRPVREAFSLAVHGKKVAWIKSYWQKMVFSGRATPPPELDSDAQVLDFVRRNSGSIGYVSPGTSLGSGVKVLRVTAE